MQALEDNCQEFFKVEVKDLKLESTVKEQLKAQKEKVDEEKARKKEAEEKASNKAEPEQAIMKARSTADAL